VTDTHSNVGPRPFYVRLIIHIYTNSWKNEINLHYKLLSTHIDVTRYIKGKETKQSKLNFGSYLMLHVLHVSALQSHHQIPEFQKRI